jgi:transcriptional regulator with XRE-family HTH domain
LDGDLGLEAGRSLRRLRKERGLTLREVGRASGGRFTPTAVAGYERGERTISLVRFCELVKLYEAAPDRILRGILNAESPNEHLIDLEAVDALPSLEAGVIRSFVTEILHLRGESLSDPVVLREGDLEILAGAAGRTAKDLLQDISAARERSRPAD